MSSTETAAPVAGSKMEQMYAMLDEKRFGLTAGIIVCVMALGAMSMTLGSFDYVTRMSICLFPTMAVLCLYIAPAPIKLLMRVTAITIVIDLIVFFTAFA